MKIIEFQTMYHEYCVQTQEEALKEIITLEKIIDEDGKEHKAKAVFFPGQGWCLMIDTAADELEHLGIPEKR